MARHTRYSTIKTYLAGIQFYAIYRGFQPSVASMHQLYYVLRGIRRRQALAGSPIPKQAISIVHLHILFNHTTTHSNNRDATMLQTAMSFVFYGMLRISEYTSSHTSRFVAATTLLVQDVFLLDNILHISVKASKTDPFRSSTVIRLSAFNGRTCPVTLFSQFSRSRVHHSGPFFAFVNGSYLTRGRLSSMIQACFPGANINTHSFRIGGASAASSAGIADSSIQVLGRWRSDAYLRYLRFSDNDIVSFFHRISSNVHLQP